LLGFLRKKTHENPPPPKIFPYNKFENHPLEKFLATKAPGPRQRQKKLPRPRNFKGGEGCPIFDF